MPGSGIPGNATAKRYADMLAEFSNCTPLIIPARGDNYDFEELLDHFDGIMLTGGRANIEPIIITVRHFQMMSQLIQTETVPFYH